MVERGGKFLTNPDVSQIPKTVDVVIIGGGMAGTAAAWALGRVDPTLSVVVLEKNVQLASGDSTASLENFRTCWPTPCLAHLMERSVHIFLHADEFLGEGATQSLDVKKHGYLYCGFTEGQARELRSEADHLHSIGLPHIEFLHSREIRIRFPWLAERVIAAKFDPLAGWLDSNSLAHLFAKASGDRTRFLLGMDDVAIMVEKDRIVGVATKKATIATGNVIIAAGAGSREVGKNAGLDIPVIVRPNQSFTINFRHDTFPPDAPFLIGAAPYPYVRPQGERGTIFGWEHHWRNKNTQERQTLGPRDYLEKPINPPSALTDLRHPAITLMLLSRQFGHTDGNGFSHPSYLAHPKPATGYYVYRAPHTTYRIDADGNRQFYDSERPILDAYPGVDGLFLSVAHAGHGVMGSAASGEVVASYVLKQPLPNTLFAEFQLNVPYVPNDCGGL